MTDERVSLTAVMTRMRTMSIWTGKLENHRMIRAQLKGAQREKPRLLLESNAAKKQQLSDMSDSNQSIMSSGVHQSIQNGEKSRKSSKHVPKKSVFKSGFSRKNGGYCIT